MYLWVNRMVSSEVVHAFTESLRDALSAVDFNEEISFDRFSEQWWKHENFFIKIYTDMQNDDSVQSAYYEDGF